MSKYHCHYCHKQIADEVYPYTLRLELFPAVEPSLEIRDEDLEIDFEAEMKRLIDLMDQMEEADVRRQEKQMFMSFTFTLCPRCRDRLADQLGHLAPPA